MSESESETPIKTRTLREQVADAMRTAVAAADQGNQVAAVEAAEEATRLAGLATTHRRAAELAGTRSQVAMCRDDETEIWADARKAQQVAGRA